MGYLDERSMIRSFRAQHFKSLEDLEVELGRVTVLIGENGCGKSNILESIAFAAAAEAGKAEHEFLASRGVRMTDPRMMVSAYRAEQPGGFEIIVPTKRGLPSSVSFVLNDSLKGFAVSTSYSLKGDAELEQLVERLRDKTENAVAIHRELEAKLRESVEPLPDFIIFSPENSALRTFQAEGQILPLGVRGEGLFALLKWMTKSDEGRRSIAAISEQLTLLDWFQSFEVPAGLAPGERTLNIVDRFLADGSSFDQRSANEGFLFLLFYFALILAPGTPRFFAIDNVDASLNPHLCEELIRRLVSLAKQQDKQVILTTHNPSVLDGLDLSDDEVRLLVVHRNRSGHTRVRRVDAPKHIEGVAPVRLSEAFLRGYLGGLPKNF